MSTFTVFHTYTPLDFITNLNLNGNILNIVTAGNAIDRTNMQSGSGIDASSMNPASAPAATFGGSQLYTFGPGVAITGGLTYGTLTLAGPSVMQSELDFTGTTVSAGQVAIGGDAGGTKGLLLNVPTGSTNGFELQSNDSTVAQVNNTGVLSTTANGQTNKVNGSLQSTPTINGTAVASFNGPGYTSAGAALANTFHIASGTAHTGTFFNVTVNISAAAVFSSQTSYAVYFSYANAVPPAVTAVRNVSGSQFTITSPAGPASDIQWTAVGT
jgi:hypothetical protein